LETNLGYVGQWDMWTSLYVRDRDFKIRLAYNEFEYKKTLDYHKLEDRFQKKGHFSISYTQNCR
jgi:hypothetical protein